MHNSNERNKPLGRIPCFKDKIVFLIYKHNFVKDFRFIALINTNINN